jgi:hypothetical protein
VAGLFPDRHRPWLGRILERIRDFGQLGRITTFLFRAVRIIDMRAQVSSCLFAGCYGLMEALAPYLFFGIHGH